MVLNGLATSNTDKLATFGQLLKPDFQLGSSISLKSDPLPTICSWLSLVIKVVSYLFFELVGSTCGRAMTPRGRRPSLPPMVLNTVKLESVAPLECDEANVLRSGRNQVFKRGNSIGRFVVTSDVKASRVPHAPASLAPLTESCFMDQLVRLEERTGDESIV